MEPHPVIATPWFVVLAVALIPIFALFIADITGWAFAYLGVSAAREVSPDGEGEPRPPKC